MDRSEDGIPHELKERLGSFDAAVSAVESMLQPLLSTSHTDLVEKVSKGRSLLSCCDIVRVAQPQQQNIVFLRTPPTLPALLQLSSGFSRGDNY